MGTLSKAVRYLGQAFPFRLRGWYRAHMAFRVIPSLVFFLEQCLWLLLNLWATSVSELKVGRFTNWKNDDTQLPSAVRIFFFLAWGVNVVTEQTNPTRFAGEGSQQMFTRRGTQHASISFFLSPCDSGTRGQDI